MNIKCVNPAKKKIIGVLEGSFGLGNECLELIFTTVQSKWSFFVLAELQRTLVKGMVFNQKYIFLSEIFSCIVFF